MQKDLYNVRIKAAKYDRAKNEHGLRVGSIRRPRRERRLSLETRNGAGAELND